MNDRPDNATAHSSSEYDSQILKIIPYYDSFHAETIRIVEAVNAQPRLWLDTGGGTGTLIEKALEQFRSTRFILSDPSDGMLEAARTKLRGYEQRVKILSPSVTSGIDPETLGGPPDVMTTIQAHHYLTVPEREETTEFCVTLLERGGIFITFENIAPSTEAGTEYGKTCWGNYQRSLGKTSEQVAQHLERYGRDYFPITVEEHLDLYRRCGFRVVELLWYSCMQAGFYCVK